METTNKTLVMVKDSRYGGTHYREYESFIAHPRNDVIISRPLQVEFEMLTKSDQVNNEIAVIKEIRDKGMADAQVVANLLDDRISSLLAIESK